MTLVRERVVVDPAPGANLGKVRARSVEQIAEMRRLRAGGVAIPAIAHAYGLSTRTVHRYVKDDEVYDVSIDGWTATFAVRRGHEPVRVSRWERLS